MKREEVIQSVTKCFPRNMRSVLSDIAGTCYDWGFTSGREFEKDREQTRLQDVVAQMATAPIPQPEEEL